jgi:hypothetical protein
LKRVGCCAAVHRLSENLAVLVRDKSRAAFERHRTTQVTPDQELEMRELS